VGYALVTIPDGDVVGIAIPLVWAAIIATALLRAKIEKLEKRSKEDDER